MLKELEHFTEELLEKYPLCFSEQNTPVCKVGIQTMDGWKGIIDNALSQIQGLCETVPSTMRPYVFSIINENGKLSIDVRPHSLIPALQQPIDSIVNAAYMASINTCEYCGTNEGVLPHTIMGVRTHICAECERGL